MMYQAGLILEGGGMKGIYTAGVLDFFMDKEVSETEERGRQDREGQGKDDGSL